MLDPERAPPSEPSTAWAKAYELPSARHVVSAGLQLAVAASRPIRRASIYIGLLALGAFGPTILLFFVVVARLLGDASIGESVFLDPAAVLIDRPELVAPLQLLYVLGLVGTVLLIAISIDAQAIAIALLGGVASERPLRLAEAVTRARQSFWRLVGAGLIVSLASFVVAWVVTIPFVRPFESNAGVSFIGSIVGALVVTPWAFAGTGIVLGDVGAMDALRRSVTLFRARPRIAFVVVLFTLVTAAIQTFAIGTGLEVAVRIGELLNIGPERGAASLILPAILVLAFVVAFGSLTFTIAAIVAAPQVAAFLGLTFYSGGLDRARSVEGGRAGIFHWVSAPSALAMVGIALGAALGVSMITG